MNPSDLSHRIDVLTQMASEARAFVEAGQAIDLRRFEGEVESACRAARDLPAPDGRAVAPALHRLEAALAGLESSLRAGISGPP
ncbi:MAG: hypothetical protein ACT4P2_04205 [Pseudomonadota bacterium]